MADFILQAKDIRKSFDSVPALKGIDLSVERGDVIAIIGPSGGGKTTLLRCLNFLEKADSGSIDFEGSVTQLNSADKKIVRQIRLRTGFVFQNFNLFRNKNALENITLGLTSARRIKKEEAKKNGIKLLEKVGLSDKINRYPHELSGGQQQRVAIARALACDPELIYFDEPTSALDPELTGEVQQVIRSLAREGMTMIIVTHELNFAQSVSTKTIFLENGSIVESGFTKEFFDSPKEERSKAFLSRSTKND